MSKIREEMQEALMAQHVRARQDAASDALKKEMAAQAENDEKAVFNTQLALVGSFAKVSMGFRAKPQQMTMDLMNLAKNALMCFGAMWGQASHGAPAQATEETVNPQRTHTNSSSANGPSMDAVGPNNRDNGQRGYHRGNGRAASMEAVIT